MKAAIWFSTILWVIAVATGCRSVPTQGTGATSSATSRALSVATAGATAGSRVAQVVFIGQREACECTRNRIDTTWAALEQALADHPEIEVKKLEQDVQQEEADRYDELEPLMVAPGVYLMDEDGKLVQMLQGALTSKQLQQAIGGKAARASG